MYDVVLDVMTLGRNQLKRDVIESMQHAGGFVWCSYLSQKQQFEFLERLLQTLLPLVLLHRVDACRQFVHRRLRPLQVREVVVLVVSALQQSLKGR